ncbi:TolC family protein [Granulosicoccaceae sp. 1_MG-2023]|nr:TolC family protein [Granulosicoccaceae sp. 1_MG-2023]
MVFSGPAPLRPTALLLMLGLSGCAGLQTATDHRADLNDQLEAVPAWQTEQAAYATAVTQLDALLDEAALRPLISRALANNPSLAQTRLSMEILQAQERQIRAGGRPTVSAGYGASRSEGEDTFYTGSVDISWEPDVWSAVRNQTLAARASTASQRALYDAARATLAADVIKAWLNLIDQQRTIDLETRRLELLNDTHEFIQARYRAGTATLEDLLTARTNVASTRATISAAEASYRSLQNALKVLLGETDGEIPELPEDYPQVLTPLAGLPAQTLARRPDLVAAWEDVRAADLSVQVAYRDMLPSLSLSAALQDIAESPEKALLNDPVWSLLGQLTAPLYQGGQLQAAADSAELTAAQAVAAYRETLVTAVSEVDDALTLETAYGEQIRELTQALDDANTNLQRYRDNYRHGLTDLLDLLTIQEQTFDLQSQLNAVLLNRLSNRIDLALALGLGVQE